MSKNVTLEYKASQNGAGITGRDEKKKGKVIPIQA
jgi:hypothetical protein